MSSWLATQGCSGHDLFVSVEQSDVPVVRIVGSGSGFIEALVAGSSQWVLVGQLDRAPFLSWGRIVGGNGPFKNINFIQLKFFKALFSPK